MDKEDILKFKGQYVACYFIGGLRKVGTIIDAKDERFYVKDKCGKYIRNEFLIAVGDTYA